jgi:ankyrin repeat protein
VIHKLIELGADPNSRTSTGACPLHVACQWGQLEAVEALVIGGGDLSARTLDGHHLLGTHGRPISLFNGRTPIQICGMYARARWKLVFV